jgi:murein DD-endopeptidase MepM/ murein hydrolase activator NlpD
MKKWLLIGFLIIILALILNWIYAKMSVVKAEIKLFGKPLQKLIIRVDAKGNGGFWKSRIGRYHEGVDFICVKNETVYSPIDGKIIRIAYPYANDKRYEGCVIRNDATGLEVKLFYMKLSKAVGSEVRIGDKIGVCQDVAAKYGGGMKPHLHIEIRKDNQLINPETVFNV